MSAQPNPPRISVEEYFRLDREAEFKSEYFDGEMYAMSGGSPAHAIIGANLIFELKSALRSKGCTVASSDMRVRVGPRGRYAYPDATVFCGEGEYAEEDKDTLLNPALLIEVLSPSTEVRDRIQKSDLYRNIKSLREYALVSQSEPRVQVFTRQADGWLISEFKGMDTPCRFRGMDFEIAMSEIYLGVKVSPQSDLS
jgi:Uma2 family endonuclease